MQKSLLEKQIKDKGHRMTQVRSRLIELFSSSDHKLFTAAELLKILPKGVNKTTVYRELEFLMREKLIRQVLFPDGVARYELMDHHHHLICTTCGETTMVNISEDLDEQISKQAKKAQFVVESHSLEFLGRCKNCHD